jgi:hypothetical protein
MMASSGIMFMQWKAVTHRQHGYFINWENRLKLKTRKKCSVVQSIVRIDL